MREPETTYAVLTPTTPLSLQDVSDINALLKMQRGNTTAITREMAQETARQSRVVIARNNAGRIIGIGVLALVRALSHTHATLHNLVVAKGYDLHVVTQSILEELVRDMLIVAYIEAGAWLQDQDGLVPILASLGFEEKTKPRYRRRFRQFENSETIHA